MDYRKIIHIDMDAFYASIEQRDNPFYRNKPLAVGYSGPRGVVAAASYEARKYGVRSAMSSYQAKKLCSHLIFAPSRMDVYKETSTQIHEIFHEYTDIIEPLSLDEAFLDVTQNKKNIELAQDIAKEIKKKIKKQLNLTASAGVSYNKFLAKIASDYRKPDGLYIIHPDRAIKFIEKLPIESFWGIGKVTAKKMHNFGINNGKELKQQSLPFLIRNFGKAGKIYYNFARGIDNREVEVDWIRKSVGCEETFDRDISTDQEIFLQLEHLTDYLIKRLDRAQFHGRTLTLKIKFNDFKVITRSRSVGHDLLNFDDIFSLSKTLYSEQNFILPKIRLLGLSISNPKATNSEEKPYQLKLNLD